MPVTVTFNFTRTIRSAVPRKLIRTADGDTPFIEQPIRMVSCDTPEKAGYAGGPATSQPKLNACRTRLQDGFYPQIPAGLRTYLVTKLTNDAAQRHIDAGVDATAEFDKALEARLTRPDGSKRNTATIPTGEIIDRYGRMLAYLAPWFSGSQSDPLPPVNDPRRRTFNVEMIETGWAAFFPIYPSLPRNADFNLAIAAAESAWNGKLGAWQRYGADLLLAYEYRACIKLGTAATAQDGMDGAFQRICIDLRTMTNKGLFGFFDVPPPYRLWVWQADVAQATADLGII